MDVKKEEGNRVKVEQDVSELEVEFWRMNRQREREREFEEKGEEEPPANFRTLDLNVCLQVS